MTDFEFGWLDQICLYAYSEACFSNRSNIPLPFLGTEPIGGTPPQPYGFPGLLLKPK